MAAKLRRDLAIDVDMIHGRYGEYRILVDGQTVIDGGALAALGVVPASRRVVEAVRAYLSRDSGGADAV